MFVVTNSPTVHVEYSNTYMCNTHCVYIYIPGGREVCYSGSRSSVPKEKDVFLKKKKSNIDENACEDDACGYEEEDGGDNDDNDDTDDTEPNL